MNWWIITATSRFSSMNPNILCQIASVQPSPDSIIVALLITLKWKCPNWTIFALAVAVVSQLYVHLDLQDLDQGKVLRTVQAAIIPLNRGKSLGRGRPSRELVCVVAKHFLGENASVQAVYDTMMCVLDNVPDMMVMAMKWTNNNKPNTDPPRVVLSPQM